MKNWNEFLEEKSKNDLPSPEETQYTMFFKKSGKYYAVKEEDRIIFAKIKTKDTKDINANKEEIIFRAKEIESGEEQTFNSEDVKNIKVCSKKEAELSSGKLYKNKEQGGKNMCKCKCEPCLKGKCEKCNCVNCVCEGCSCSK